MIVYAQIIIIILIEIAVAAYKKFFGKGREIRTLIISFRVIHPTLE